MKKQISGILIILVMIASLSACTVGTNSNLEKTVNESSVSSSSVSYKKDEVTSKKETETKTKELASKSTTNQIKKAQRKNTTAQKTVTTQTKTTTTKKVVTTHRKTTTTKKAVTTQKKTTTTKKVTTTKAYWCDEGGTHHTCKVGIGGWVNSYDKAQDNALNYIAKHNTSGNYTVQQCMNCGKYTVYVTLD